MLGRNRAPADAAPDPTDTLRWMAGWLGTAVVCLLGPHYDRAMLLPATCMLVIAALPILAWLGQARAMRYALATVAIVVHASSWWNALTRYHSHHATFVARMDALEHARPGHTVAIHHYSPAPEDDWFLGEDLGNARLRQLVAIEAFGLRDIAIEPRFDGSTRTQGSRRFAARPMEPRPRIYAPRTCQPSGPTTCRLPASSSKLFVERLAHQVHYVSARLVVKNVNVPLCGSRRLFVAWADRTGRMIPRVLRSSAAQTGEYTVKVYRPEAERLDQAFALEDGQPKPIPYRGGQLQCAR